MSITIDTPEGISMWVLLSRISQLALELKTGMRHSRGSVLASCWYEGFTAKRTKKGALLDLLTLMKAIDPEWALEDKDIYLEPLVTEKMTKDKIVRKIERDALKWRTVGRPGAIQA